MSHVCAIEVEIKDLGALGSACEKLGLQLNREQKEFRYWAGRRQKCEHAIEVLGKEHAYQMGLEKNKDGKSYKLLWDSYAGGNGLVEAVGKNASKLVQEYAVQVALKQARVQGMAVQRKQLENGKVQLVCRPRVALQR